MPFSRTFWINETQEQLERQPVSRKLLQTLSTGATCQRPARYTLHTDRAAIVCLAFWGDKGHIISARMATRLLSYAKKSAVTFAVTTTTPSTRSYYLSRTAVQIPDPPLLSRVCPSGTSPPGQVQCVCGDEASGKSTVECVSCSSWSHIQCARLTIDNKRERDWKRAWNSHISGRDACYAAGALNLLARRCVVLS